MPAAPSGPDLRPGTSGTSRTGGRPVAPGTGTPAADRVVEGDGRASPPPRDPRATWRARDVRAIAALHALLLAAGAVALLLPVPAQGWAVLACVVGYVVLLPLVARAVDRPDWLAMWALLLPVSVFQVLPDWILADLVGTLAFPDVGGPRVDDVIPVAMAGMWVVPLFVALALGGGRPGRTAALAAGIFLGTELVAPVVDLWEPTGDTTRVLGVALYVLPAEAALGWAVAVAYGLVRGRTVAVRVGAALAVSTFYTGALVVSHFLIDVAGWRVTA